MKWNLNTTTPERYQQMVNRLAPPSPIGKNCRNAFLVGGAICSIGQIFLNLFTLWGLSKADAGTATSVIMVFLGALLTGLGVYDRIARFAGAGTLVPITGFSNAVTSPTIEFKMEGAMGLAAKTFVIAGPVIVYGTAASAVYGIILFLLSLLS